ncbi:Uncharacterised protein [Mycobacteroides abscessus subsp. abscessus]|nr:Uncharacterised protein [Mycobacteroides abscessus subsp. abscessus]
MGSNLVRAVLLAVRCVRQSFQAFFWNFFMAYFTNAIGPLVNRLQRFEYIAQFKLIVLIQRQVFLAFVQLSPFVARMVIVAGQLPD